MDLEDLREEIDHIDDALVPLFLHRMELSAQVADYKKENNIPIRVPSREREKLLDVSKKAGPLMDNYTEVLYSMLFELSRSYQSKRNAPQTPLYQRIKTSIEDTPNLFPQNSMIACQGMEGAYAQTACEKMFKNPFLMYFNNIESVFEAVNQGLCQYGVLPIENSVSGSVKKVYDFLSQYNFSIIRAFRMRIDLNLLALPGAELEKITEIYSHEQAISQCSVFLRSMPGIKVIPVSSTAAAADIVSKSGRTDIAAISSDSCAELYSLQCISSSIQDKKDNKTRFISFSKNLEIYPGSDRTSIMMVLPHKPGSLYKVLARLYVLGININKLESRPVPGNEFKIMFYFELETSIYSDEFVQLMSELDDLCEEFQYFGSYAEVI